MEVDFLFQTAERVVPVEAKAEDNVKSHSLSNFVRNDFAEMSLKGLRMSMKPYIDQGWMENIPLYSAESYIKNQMKQGRLLMTSNLWYRSLRNTNACLFVLPDALV